MNSPFIFNQSVALPNDFFTKDHSDEWKIFKFLCG